MSRIDDTDYYAGLPRVHLLTSDFKYIFLGWYDPDLNRDTEFAYQPGKFMKKDGSPYDNIYKDKQCMVVSFKHQLLPYRWARNLAGHRHIKYIVPTGLIRPHDVLREDPESKDIIIFADLARSPPILEGDKPQEILLEITPHLSPEELARLPKDIKFITKIKERLHELDSENWTLKGELVQEHSIAIASTSALFAAQERLDQLVREYQNIYDTVITLRLSTRKTIIQGIEKTEAENFLGAPWSAFSRADMDETAKVLQSEIRALSANLKLNGKLTDSHKYQLVMQTANVVGLDYMRKVLLGLEEYKYPTSQGMQALTISRDPTPQELFIKECELYETGQTSLEEFKERANRILSKMNERYKRPEISPLAATQELKGELLRKVAPEMQVSHAPPTR